MSEELADEVTSINAIYGDNTLNLQPDAGQTYTFVLPARPAVALKLEFAADYPDTPPSILGTHHVGDGLAKGEGAEIVDAVRDVLAAIYVPGTPCLYDLIEESGQRLQQLGLDDSSRSEESQSAQENGVDTIISSQDYLDGSDQVDQSTHDLGSAPPWTMSDVITEKKSVFIARTAFVSSVDQAKTFLAHLLATDKKAAKATHNITAWRIRGENGVQYQDCDDDGETAAGGRVLHLLELMDVWDIMIVVTRWYGGVHLGPDRFRIINQVARDAVVKGGFIEDAGKDSGKKKGRK